ncbi:hypothetical protein HBI26_031140 [Parastagonospora nodorum]|nr:hypothetical protein HBI10_078550 [Parastagonospora nodorum]KAH4032078.1 hypothetical protein HBI13_019660 [Parastagonospora nodorum]KAH4234230.1 hypothetical protein HBI05_155310 [Parastagonospora nodorum]KAH4243713.1 hypothetical protein HBI06_005120 [Parastagonospora nodorum]KAH5192296.1 hypothetical protein HBH76_070350 [Parastagonospora nodorum]
MIDIAFPRQRDDWSLDVVNILAFLGEHNIQACSQQICMSWTCFLPRLMPAPQGLLAQRPKTLASEDGIPVMGIHSGYSRESLQYFGRMLHTDGSELPAFSTRVLKIGRTQTCDYQRAPIRPRLISLLNLIAILSCAMSLGLAAWALVLGDAVAFTGILVMSFTTPLLCMGMRWKAQIFCRKTLFKDGMLPPETVVLRSQNGCITVVECDEEVARWLYFHPVHIEYTVSSFVGRGLSGIVGGITLVCSIILFGNAVWTIKAALAVTYTALNLLYWIAAILPARLSWHMDFDLSPPQITHHYNFAQFLWSAIYTTKSSEWAVDCIPNTKAWRQWLSEAQSQALWAQRHESWIPTAAFHDIMEKQNGRMDVSTIRLCSLLSMVLNN